MQARWVNLDSGCCGFGAEVRANASLRLWSRPPTKQLQNISISFLEKRSELLLVVIWAQRRQAHVHRSGDASCAWNLCKGTSNHLQHTQGQLRRVFPVLEDTRNSAEAHLPAHIDVVGRFFLSTVGDHLGRFCAGAGVLPLHSSGWHTCILDKSTRCILCYTLEGHLVQTSLCPGDGDGMGRSLSTRTRSLFGPHIDRIWSSL